MLHVELVMIYDHIHVELNEKTYNLMHLAFGLFDHLHPKLR